MATQATPDEFRRIDKWRCKVADDCVAELRNLKINNEEDKDTTSRSTPSVKDDSLVLYKPHTREEVFDDVNSHGKPVTVIRRYRSQKGSPPGRKSAPQIVQVIEDPSSSSSGGGSRRARTERPTTTYRSSAGGQGTRYRSDDRSERSYRPRRDRDAVKHTRSSHRRHKSEVARTSVPEQKSTSAAGTALSRSATLRRMLKLSSKDVKVKSREDSAHGAARSTTTKTRRSGSDSRTRARSADGRETSYGTRRGSGQDSSTRRDNDSTYRSRDAYSGSYAPTREEALYRDIRDARQYQRPRSVYNDIYDRSYDRSYDDNRTQPKRTNTYVSNTAPIRRSQTLNRGSDRRASRYPTYDSRDTYHDGGRVNDDFARAHRDVERYRTQARNAPSRDGYGRDDYSCDYGYGYEQPCRDGDRRRSVYSGYGYER